MAATLTLVAATPHMIKYAYAYTGSGGADSGTAFKSRAQLIADAKTADGASQLAAKLEAVAAGDYANLDQSADISVALLPTIVAAQKSLTAEVSLFIPDGAGLKAIATDGTAASGIIEIRANHTLPR